MKQLSISLLALLVAALAIPSLEAGCRGGRCGRRQVKKGKKVKKSACKGGSCARTCKSGRCRR